MDVIKYNNISEEGLNHIITFVDNQFEVFIIHKFFRYTERDYIVIGKIRKNKLHILNDAQFSKWMLIYNEIATDYKKPLVNKEEIFNNFLFNNISKQVLFTLEGYNLLTNKFKYTDFIINRTVSIGTIRRDGNLLYNKSLNCNDADFFDLSYLHGNYLFTKTELNRLSKLDFLYYLKENLFKVNNISKQDSYFSQCVGLCGNIIDKIDFIMEYISLNDINHKNKHVKTYNK